MKIPNRREPQQSAFNHLSDSFLVIDAALASDDHENSRFRKNLLEKI